MENIEKFKKDVYYNANGVLSDEEAKKLGLGPSYTSLDECAYQCAYDISNDWAQEQPTWNDVQEAYKRGVEDGIRYQKENG